MGRKVNVVLPSGEVVAVDEAVAKQSGLSRDTSAQLTGRGVAESNAEQSSGVVEGAKAFGEGAADAATLGAYGAIRGAVDPEGAEDMRIRAQERGGMRLLGETAAVVAGGVLGPLAGAGGAARAAGTAMGGGRIGAGVEGAILGVGGYISSTNVTGDPLTIEAAIEAATIGGVLDIGMTAAADKLEGMVWKGKTINAKRAIEAEELQLASKGKEIFKDTPPSWHEFVELHEARASSIKTYNKTVAKEIAEYEKHLSPAGLNDTIGEFDKARTSVMAEVQKDPAIRSAMDVHSKATKAFEATQRDYDKLLTNDEAFTQRLNQLQEVLEAKKSEFAPLGAPTDIHKVKNVGTRGSISADGRFNPMKKGSFKTGTPKQAISEQLDAQLKEYNKRLSRIYQLKTGKYKGNLDSWERGAEASFGDSVQGAATKAQAFGERKAYISSVYDNLPPGSKPKTLEEFKEQLIAAHKRGEIILHRADLPQSMDQKLVDASATKTGNADFHFIERVPSKGGGSGGADGVPNMELALKEAAALRDDIAKHFGGKKIARIPAKPTAPVEPTLSVDPAVNARIQAARDIGKGINDAKTLMRQGKYEDASLVLADMGIRVGDAAKDLALPRIPLKPRQPMPELTGEFPKSIDDFARKHADQVNALAQQLDPTSYEALQRVMRDIDVRAKGNPAEDLAGLHGTLRNYRSAMSAAETRAAKNATDQAPLIQRLIERSARLSAGRAFDVGGKMGGVTRTLGSEAVSQGMRVAEGAALGYAATGGDVKGAALGGALMTGRMGLRDRLRNLVVKYGVPTASAMRKVASPLSYLSTSFPSGKPDPERDHRQLAVNRIHELQSAAMAAPDAAFLAVQGMLGEPDDIAWKMHQHVVGSLNYLVSTLPRDPGTDTKMFGSNWKPAYHETVALAHRLEAASDPVTAIARAIAGNSHPAATETLWAIYPAMMQELAQEISVAAPNLKNLTYEQASAYSNLFRTPLTGLQQPVVVSTIQGNYMTGAQQAAPPPGRPSGGASKQGPGRPAAVQTPVAGTSPGNLIGR